MVTHYTIALIIVLRLKQKSLIKLHAQIYVNRKPNNTVYYYLRD